MGRKRTPSQIQHDRTRISELMLQQYTQQEIANILAEETGKQLSRSQISYDMRCIREEWAEKRLDNYNAILQEELARIDTLERELWRTLRESSGEKTKKIIKEAVRDAGGDGSELVVSEIITHIEEEGLSLGLFKDILECHKERRRLMGIYAPKMIGIKQEVKIKSYAVVSPDDWPGQEEIEEAVEGEYEVRQLESGD